MTRRETYADLRRAGRVIGARAPEPGTPVRIGLLGCGTVGQAVVRSLIDGADTIERASGHRLEVGPVLVRDPAKERPGIDPALITTDPARVLDDPSVAIVVEVMGGVEPTLGYLRTRARPRRLGGDGQQAAAVAARPRAARGGRGGRRGAALRGLGVRRDPGDQGAARVAAGGRDRGRDRDRQRHHQLHPHRDGARGRLLRRRPRPAPRSWATPRPTPPRTSAAPTPRPRWRSWPRSPSTRGC